MQAGPFEACSIVDRTQLAAEGVIVPASTIGLLDQPRSLQSRQVSGQDLPQWRQDSDGPFARLKRTFRPGLLVGLVDDREERQIVGDGGAGDPEHFGPAKAGMDHEGGGHPHFRVVLEHFELLCHILWAQEHDGFVAAHVAGQGCHGVGAMKIGRLVEPEADAVLEEVVEELPVMPLGLFAHLQTVEKLLEQGRGDLVDKFPGKEGGSVLPDTQLPAGQAILVAEGQGAFNAQEASEHGELVLDVAGGVVGADEIQIPPNRRIHGVAFYGRDRRGGWLGAGGGGVPD